MSSTIEYLKDEILELIEKNEKDLREIDDIDSNEFITGIKFLSYLKEKINKFDEKKIAYFA